MASSGSLNTGCTLSEGASVSTTPSGNVHVSIWSTGLKCTLFPVEVIFPPLGEPWFLMKYVPPK